MMTPLVSVIMPAYNHENYIGEAIQSVLNQSYANIELIIINDGSTDGTEKIIKSFRDYRIRYFFQTNSGAHHAINFAIKKSLGQIICVINSDDVYQEFRIEKCLEKIQYTQADFVFTKLIGIDSNSNKIKAEQSAHYRAWIDWYSDALNEISSIGLKRVFLYRNLLITTSNLCARKSTLEKVGLFESYRYAHDWDMLLKLANEFEPFYIPDELLLYRIHPSNTIHENGAVSKVKDEVNQILNKHYKSGYSKLSCEEIMQYVSRNDYYDLNIFGSD